MSDSHTWTLSEVISRYGKPEKDGSTENDVPRPMIVNRWIVYEPEGIKIMFVPVPTVDDKPPFRDWNAFLFVDEDRNVVITAESAFERLSARGHEFE